MRPATHRSLSVNSSTWFYQSVEITHRTYGVVQFYCLWQFLLKKVELSFASCDYKTSMTYFFRFMKRRTLHRSLRHTVDISNSGIQTWIHQKSTWQTIQYLHSVSFYPIFLTGIQPTLAATSMPGGYTGWVLLGRSS